MERKLLFGIILLILLPISFGEILVNTADSHEFIVNTYFLTYPEQPKEVKLPQIIIEPIDTEATIYACGTTDMAFKLTNPTDKSQLYSFNIKNFVGKVELIQNVILNSRKAVIINFVLTPDCSLDGEYTPIITVETEDEIANLPLLLNILPVDFITEEDCEYHYDYNICTSDSYIRFTQGRTYEIDLPFYDPDGDKLIYSTSSDSIKIKVKEDKGILSSKWNYYGTEEIIIIAEDPYGGKAESQTYYVHVLSNGKSVLENFLISFLLYILIGVLLFFIFVIILISAFRLE